MSADQSNCELDDHELFQEWVKYHQEPTLDQPPDLAAEREELARLSTSIVDLESLHPGPKRDRKQAIARTFLELTRWRTFPINSLPDDLILHIFRQGTFCSSDNRYAPTMPLIYSAVCKRWRDLALDASWLWGFLGFADEPPYTLTRAFLERSKTAPLIIEIDISDRKFDYEFNDFWPTADYMVNRISVLLPHIHRWKSFYCCTDNWAPIHGALVMLQPLAAPILKRLEFKQNFDELAAETIPKNPIVLLGGGAPALQELVLYTVPIEWHHSSSFSNLVELELYRLSENAMPSVQDFWSMLHRSPNLRKLSLVGAGPQWDTNVARTFPAIELLSLEELELAGAREGPYTLEYTIFLVSMLLLGPALHTLDIGGYPEDSDFRRVLPLLISHFSFVNRLLLMDMQFDTETAAHWLHAMPQVKYLSVAGKTTAASVLEALTSPASRFSLDAAGDVLCPRLATLAPYDAEVAVIHEVVRIRLQIGCAIQTLVFDINSKDATQALDSLRGVVEFQFEGDIYDSDEEWTGPDPSDWDMDGA